MDYGPKQAFFRALKMGVVEKKLYEELINSIRETIKGFGFDKKAVEAMDITVTRDAYIPSEDGLPPQDHGFADGHPYYSIRFSLKKGYPFVDPDHEAKRLLRRKPEAQAAWLITYMGNERLVEQAVSIAQKAKDLDPRNNGSECRYDGDLRQYVTLTRQDMTNVLPVLNALVRERLIQVMGGQKPSVGKRNVRPAGP